MFFFPSDSFMVVVIVELLVNTKIQAKEKRETYLLKKRLRKREELRIIREKEDLHTIRRSKKRKKKYYLLDTYPL